MLKDVAYQANTREFWNSCVAVADERDYRLGGAFNDGKGQPSQSNAVSHGSSTARFNGVNVINTAKKSKLTNPITINKLYGNFKQRKSTENFTETAQLFQSRRMGGQPPRVRRRQYTLCA